MPAYLDKSEVSIDTGFAFRNGIWFWAKSEGVLEGDFAFEEFLFAPFLPLGPAYLPGKDQDVPSGP
jgi:hypothetical protein